MYQVFCKSARSAIGSLECHPSPPPNPWGHALHPPQAREWRWMTF